MTVLKDAVSEIYQRALRWQAMQGPHDRAGLRSEEIAQLVVSVCNRRQWDRLPAVLEKLEKNRRHYCLHASVYVKDAVAEAAQDMARALGELREAAMAEMSRDLCR